MFKNLLELPDDMFWRVTKDAFGDSGRPMSNALRLDLMRAVVTTEKKGILTKKLREELFLSSTSLYSYQEAEECPGKGWHGPHSRWCLGNDFTFWILPDPPTTENLVKRAQQVWDNYILSCHERALTIERRMCASESAPSYIALLGDYNKLD